MRLLVTFALGLSLGWQYAPRIRPDPTPSPAEGPFASLLEALEHAAGPAPAGDMVISGRVIGHDQHAVEGVVIAATPVPSISESETYGLIAKVRYHARERIWWRDGTRTATTAADGTYRIEGLGGASYRLRARLRGYRFSTPSRNWRGIVAPDVVEWRGHPVVWLELIVLKPDGTKPDSATIVCLQENLRFESTWTPERPHIALDIGMFWIRATAGEWQSDAKEFRGPSGRPPPPLTLMLGRKR